MFVYYKQTIQMSYKVRNVAKQRLRGYHVRNADIRSYDEYIQSQGITLDNRFDPLTAIPATGMMSVDPVLTRVSKEDVKAGKKRPMIMSIHDLAEEEMRAREDPDTSSSNIHTIQELQPIRRHEYTGIPVRPTTNPNVPKYEMKITLFNKGFERDLM
jgi:cobalamin biosynthesis Co2+ chelatase CbiK